MKITEKDLDSAILSKLNQFEGLKKEVASSPSDGYIAYGKNGFYAKHIPEIQLRTVCSSLDIANLKKAIDEPTDCDLSSKYTDIRESGKHHMAELAFRRDILPSELTELSLGAGILKAKQLLGDLYLLTEAGDILVLGEHRKIEAVYHILAKLEEGFGLRDRLFANDIVDFDVFGKVLFIATRMNGVYAYDTDKQEATLFLTETKIRTLDIAKTDALFVATDTECSFFDITNGAAIERYRTLYNNYQLPLYTRVMDDYIYVIGETYGGAPTDLYLHAWKLDAAGLSYVSIDGKLPRTERVLGGMVTACSTSMDGLSFILRGYDGSKLIRYGQDLSLTEETFPYKAGLFQQLSKDEYLSMEGQMLFHYKDGILEKLNFPVGSARFLGTLYGSFYLISGKSLYLFSLEGLLEGPAELRYRVFDSEEACNNIEILIDGDGLENLAILDEQDAPVRPSYMADIGSLTYIRLINCKLTKLFVSVSVGRGSVIRGIVRRANRLYLR